MSKTKIAATAVAGVIGISAIAAAAAYFWIGKRLGDVLNDLPYDPAD